MPTPKKKKPTTAAAKKKTGKKPLHPALAANVERLKRGESLHGQTKNGPPKQPAKQVKSNTTTKRGRRGS